MEAGGSKSLKKKKGKKPAGDSVPTEGSGTGFQSKKFIENSETAAKASGGGSD